MNTKKIKVVTFVGTRPEIIRLSRTIDQLDQFTDHTLVHTGQNYDYELNGIFFEDLEIRKPDYFLNAAGKSPMETIGQILAKGDEILDELNPEALLVLGDTNSCLITIAAKRRKIPIFHMEAGNRCFDFRVPEEINRKIVDHISDINLPYSTIARDYLIAEGFNAAQVIKTGSPMREVLNHYRKKIDASTIMNQLQLEKGKYFVVSSHREENVDASGKLTSLIQILNDLHDKYKFPIIFSTHPRTRIKLEKEGLLEKCKGVEFMKPLGFSDYVNLQMNAAVTISDSGTITEESSILGFSAINIREAHERPEGMEEAAVMMTGLNKDRVMQAIDILMNESYKSQQHMAPIADYLPDNVSEKVLRIIISYVDYVKNNVWKKA
ncbi:MAG TPA: UDP-N-acetylglucosamine 2-epimerase (non-hydrolyzing) [Chitinophagaceae bacterium]|nr:UDP-N-acetylglucosamine 2-epimerase (non-hydrolyzing) [Chitinophagaceae bacterium]